ncbi:ferredoxin [Candidatus Pacearchaeota archaeon]|nr:ferredoxin [Candidatus Pacearchaeota archaeon]MBD3283786.1 ferredoxin [Candidatus Pacearchaeota archaeon]
MVKVNQDECIGCGSCAAMCGEVFEMKDGKAFVKKGQENSKADCTKEAIDICPVDAIS